MHEDLQDIGRAPGRAPAPARVPPALRRYAGAAVLLLSLVPMPARAEAGPLTAVPPLDWQTIFALLFLMLGPIKILGPFVAMTQGTEPAFQRRLATRAFLFSVAAVAIAAGMGRRMLASFAIPLQVLVLTGGLILFLVALQQVLQQYSARPPVRTEPPSFALAFSPLAFPTIVTPYGIAAVIIFMAVAPDATASAMVAGLVLLVLALDWVAMLFAHTVIRWLGAVLQLFGVILGVTQVALGLEIILRSLGRLGVVEAGGP
jgi:multiple antibiotic resistance protein